MSKTICTLYRTDNINRLFTDLRDCKPMTKEEEQEAFAKYRAGDEKAKEAIIRSNLLFVVEQAKKWNNADKFTDFFAEGVSGLIKAFDTFDETKGIKFFSYARHSINQALSDYALNDRMVVNTNAKLIGAKVGKIQERFFVENGRQATEDEIIEKIEADGKISVKDKRDVILASSTSINEGIGEDDCTPEESGEFAMVSASHNEFEDTIESEDRTAQCKRFMQCLAPKEYQVISMAFGFDNGMELDDEDIAERMGVTKERVRQIRTGAIKKMHSIAVRKTSAM
jgi:RNA polymerase primary sigma factor